MITADQHLSFSVAYAMYHHRLGSRFYGRLDKLVSFLLLIGAMAVVSEAVPSFLLGLLITVLSAWQLIYTPGAKSVSARSQEQRYAELLECFPFLEEAEIRKRLLDLRQHDCELPGSIEMPAYASACRKLNATNRYPLSCLERFSAWFCG